MENENIITDFVGQICKLPNSSNAQAIANYDAPFWIRKYYRSQNYTILKCFIPNSEEIPCDTLFLEVFTLYGLCYNFNGLWPEDLYKNSR